MTDMQPCEVWPGSSLCFHVSSLLCFASSSVFLSAIRMQLGFAWGSWRHFTSHLKRLLQFSPSEKTWCLDPFCLHLLSFLVTSSSFSIDAHLLTSAVFLGSVAVTAVRTAYNRINFSLWSWCKTCRRSHQVFLLRQHFRSFKSLRSFSLA